MRALDPSLKAHLDSGATTLATCWRIARRDGAVFGFTDHDRPINFNGTTFEPDAGATGSAATASADLSIDNSEIEGALSSVRLKPAELAAGRFDGASVEVWRVNWADPNERALLRTGVIGETKRDGNAFTAEIRGLSHFLDQTVGRLYQRHCDAVLGDARCGVDLTDPQFRTSGTVLQVADDQNFIADGFEGFADNWFAHGLLTWTGGANAGTTAHIKAQAGGVIGAAVSLWIPAGAPVAAGDTFIATAGCDKRFVTCKDKFNNAVNFRGFHLMPGNDFVVSYPLRGEKNDGGKRS